MLERPEAQQTLHADRISLCLVLGLVAAEAVVLLGMFWL